MPTLRISLLGDFRLVYGQEPVTTVTSARLQSFIAYLLLHRDAPQPRHYLAFLFWPDSSETQARSSLRNLLHQLRQALPDADRFVRTKGQAIQWSSDAPFMLDVAEFEDAIDRAENVGDEASMGAALEKAVALYQGDLLPSCYDDWIISVRDHLRRQYRDQIEKLVQWLEQRREYRSAIQYAQKLLQHDPLHETAYRQLMRLYALEGDRASALRAYHNCVNVLQRELGVEPDAATRALHDQLIHAMAMPARRGQPLDAAHTAPALIGRSHEWPQLQASWGKAASGHLEFVVLAGEAGIGKTRLADALLAWAGRQGFSTTAARCYAAEGELAYAPVVAWLRSGLLQQAGQALDDIWLVEVARLLPEITAHRPDLPEPRPMIESWQRQRLFEALARAVLAAKRPLLMVLDDLQWCDRDTLEWLHYLLRHDPHAPLLLIATLRSEAAQSNALAVTLSSLDRSPSYTRLELGPLTPADTAAMAGHIAGHPLTAAQADLLYRETEGNPLFVEEMVRAGLSGTAEELGDRRKAPPRAAVALPPKVQAVIQERLGQLSPPTQDLVTVAAVIGRRFTFELLVAATHSDEEILLGSLDELWRRHIIREQETGAYDFSHDKIREVVYAGLSSARRRFLHRRVGEALAAVPTEDPIASGGQMAAHFEQAGSLDQAFRYYVQTADQVAALYAYLTARELYGHAIELAQKLNLPGQKLVEIYSACGRMLEHAGHYAEAVQVYHALELLGRTRHDHRMECGAVVQLVKCYLGPTAVHDPVRAAPLLQRGLSLARELKDPDLESQLLWSQMVHGSHYGADEEAQAAGKACIVVARQHGLRKRLAYVLNDLAINLRLSGQPQLGQECADEARTLFREMENLPMVADSLSQQAWSDYHTLDFDRALQFATECIALSQEIHNGWNLALATLVRGMVRVAQGAWGEALVDLEASRRFGEEAGFVVTSAVAPGILGALLREIGQPDRAWTLHHQAHAVSTGQAPFLLHAIEAQVALDAFAGGQVTEGERWLAAMLTHQPRGAIARAWFTFADPAMAIVAGAEYTGKWAAALEVVEAYRAEAQQRRLPIYLPALLALRGRCLVMLGRSAEAESSLQNAIAAAQVEGLRPVLWQAHAALSELHHRQNRNPQADMHRAAAAEIVHEIASSFTDPVQRDSFLATPPVRRLLKDSI